MKLVFTENVHHLELPAGHRFPLGKYGALKETLHHAFPELFLLGAPANTRELCLVHDENYIERVDGGDLRPDEVRRIGFPWSPSLALRARRSVGGTLAALAWAMQEGAAGHLAGGTHHAHADGGEGFCVFNDLAVAARVAQEEYGVDRVAVIDLDVHQGNGTAEIFKNSPAVFTLSLHGARNFPFAKATSDLDVPLADGCTDAPYVEALRAALATVRAFRPELILFQAGVDCLAGDRLGRAALTLEGLKARDQLVFDLARSLAIPLVVTLGGGYGRDIAKTVEAHANVFRGLVAAFT